MKNNIDKYLKEIEEEFSAVLPRYFKRSVIELKSEIIETDFDEWNVLIVEDAINKSIVNTSILTTKDYIQDELLPNNILIIANNGLGDLLYLKFEENQFEEPVYKCDHESGKQFIISGDFEDLVDGVYTDISEQDDEDDEDYYLDLKYEIDILIDQKDPKTTSLILEGLDKLIEEGEYSGWAHYKYGMIFQRGIFVKKHFEKAYNHFIKSRDIGFDLGDISVGFCYLFGIHVGQDLERAKIIISNRVKYNDMLDHHLDMLEAILKKIEIGEVSKESIILRELE